MPTRPTFGAETCRAGLTLRPADNPNRYHCANLNGGGRWWQQDPSYLQTIADNRELTIEQTLCEGCQRRLARLQADEGWPS